jgi:multidrug efflux pump subunit AcrA (membrane-fusion protein)
VIIVYQQPGNFVSKGMPVAMIADFSKIYFTIMVDEENFKNITPLDEKLSLSFQTIDMTEKALDSAPRSPFDENTAFDVEISSVSPPSGNDATVRSLTFEVDNHLGVLEIGLYTDVVIRKEASKRTLAIPISVVLDRDDPKVYVRDADSRLAVRGIKLGARDNEYVEIVEGLDEGDVVILSGVEGLDTGVRIDVYVEGDSL